MLRLVKSLTIKSMLAKLYGIDEVYYPLLSTNGFHVKAKNGRFTAAGSLCCQNIKNENFTSSFVKLRQNLHQKACRTNSTIIFSLSTSTSLRRCPNRESACEQ